MTFFIDKKSIAGRVSCQARDPPSGIGDFSGHLLVQGAKRKREKSGQIRSEPFTGYLD
jgi:hypothetical protein